MLFIGPLIAACVFALAFAVGGRTERETAAVMTGVLILSLALGLTGRPHDQFPAALSDVVLMGGFMFLAVRHRRLWLYAELAVAGVLVIVQLTHDEVLSPTPGLRTFVNALNLVALGLLLSATVATRVRRPGLATAERVSRSARL